jgi:hypothetical protein
LRESPRAADVRSSTVHEAALPEHERPASSLELKHEAMIWVAKLFGHGISTQNRRIDMSARRSKPVLDRLRASYRGLESMLRGS